MQREHSKTRTLEASHSLLRIIKKTMTFIFDGRNLMDNRRLYEIGFNVHTLGKPPLTHFVSKQS